MRTRNQSRDSNGATAKASGAAKSSLLQGLVIGATLVAACLHARLGYAQTPALTTVKDTVYKTDGSLASGTIVITWPAFNTADAKPVFGGTKTFTLTSGTLATALVPNAGGTPSGTSYNVKYYQSGGVFFEETWVVPSSSPLTDPTIPVSVTQAGAAGTTTYYYWCTATNANGETLLSPSRITTTSNATLSGTNYNIILCATVTGAAGYKAYRTTTTTAPSGTGLFLVGSAAGTTINDQSNTLTSATIPALNTTDPRTLAQVRVLGIPSPAVVIAATQVTGTAVVQNPAAGQTITAAPSGVPLAIKGKSGNSGHILDIYDNAGTPNLQSFFDSGGKFQTAQQITSTLAAGTAPFSVASTTKVANLNADQLDDVDIAAIGRYATTGNWSAAQKFKTANAIRYADQFAGANYTAKVQAAADDFSGAFGLVVSSSDMGVGDAPNPLPTGISVLDLRNTNSGAVLLLHRLATGNPYGLNVTIQNSPDGTNGGAIIGDVRPAGNGTNIIGLTGFNASNSSSAVLGFNAGSGGLGGPGIQGDSANLPQSIGVLGTSASSGSTFANPSIAVKGKASGHATYGAAVAGLFEADNAQPLVANLTAAAGATIDPQVLLVQSGLNRATHLSINNISTGGKRWDLVSTGASDPFTAQAGWFYIWNQPDNRPVFAVDPATPSFAFYTDATGINFKAATSFAGKFTHSNTANRTWTLPNADTTVAGLSVAQTWTAKQTFDSAVINKLVPVTFSATPTFDASLGNSFKITLTDNVTNSTFSNAQAGQQISFLICQDSTGNRTFVWPTNVKGGVTIGAVLSTCSAQTFLYDGTNAYALSSGVTGM